MSQQAEMCYRDLSVNSQALNSTKTKELIFDCSKKHDSDPAQFFGVLSEGVSLSANTMQAAL